MRTFASVVPFALLSLVRVTEARNKEGGFGVGGSPWFADFLEDEEVFGKDTTASEMMTPKRRNDKVDKPKDVSAKTLKKVDSKGHDKVNSKMHGKVDKKKEGLERKGWFSNLSMEEMTETLE